MASQIFLAVALLMLLAALGGAFGILLVLMSVPAKWSQRQAQRRTH